VADELERPGGEPVEHEAEPHFPSPTIWPFAFAAGVALLLVGLIINWILAAIGAVLVLVFGFLWIREATSEVRRPPAAAPVPPAASELAGAEEEEEPERYPRSVFLEMSTLGVGALIGGIVTLPALGFMVAPAFVGQEHDEVDLGPLANFPKDQFVITTFNSKKDEGSVGRRTAFIRNNGVKNDLPSFTIISNRCAHLGCPTQPQGLPGKGKQVKASSGTVTITPVASVSGFQCPCHGGAYDDEGNRTAGPPVRALDRYEFLIREGNLVLGKPYSVGKVIGQAADAKIEAYRIADPGQHVDGPEKVLYPPKFWIP
jgi:quinol---cytochrome c reductase iron-sulfur subunit, bacillus type